MRTVSTIPILLSLWILPAGGSVTDYIHTQQAQWEAAVGNNFTTIDFTGWAHGTLIMDQYSALGATFTDGNDGIQTAASLYSDGAGLRSQELVFGNITVEFAADQYWFGMHHLALVQVLLYNDGNLIHESIVFGVGGLNFGGVVSTQPFDQVILHRPDFGTIQIDNLYFGPPIPAPGALACFGVGVLMHRRRRRPSA